MLKSQAEPVSLTELGPIALAFIGDGVFELMVRERLLRRGNMPANAMHALAVKRVRASSQAKAYAALSAVLTEEESGILRRGRNANSTKRPKSCTVEEYRKATAIEALLGYLYLKGDSNRLQELFDLIDSELREETR